MARRYNTRSIRLHQSFDVSQVAELLGTTQQTVRIWIKAGLPVLRTQRPTLILGFHLREFLNERNEKAKCPTAFDEFYCLCCRKPQKPLGMMADYIPINENAGRIVALCGCCESTCNRFIKKSDLPKLSRVFEIAIGVMRQG